MGEALLGDDGRPVTALIGVATWGILSGRSELENANGAYVHYRDPDSYTNPTSAIDRNHTHFIFVDDGSASTFGVEVCHDTISSLSFNYLYYWLVGEREREFF